MAFFRFVSFFMLGSWFDAFDELNWAWSASNSAYVTEYVTYTIVKQNQLIFSFLASSMNSKNPIFLIDHGLINWP